MCIYFFFPSVQWVHKAPNEYITIADTWNKFQGKKRKESLTWSLKAEKKKKTLSSQQKNYLQKVSTLCKIKEKLLKDKV